MSDMKKYILDRINSKLGTAQKTINELEDITIGTTF